MPDNGGESDWTTGADVPNCTQCSSLSFIKFPRHRDRIEQNRKMGIHSPIALFEGSIDSFMCFLLKKVKDASSKLPGLSFNRDFQIFECHSSLDPWRTHAHTRANSPTQAQHNTRTDAHTLIQALHSTRTRMYSSFALHTHAQALHCSRAHVHQEGVKPD